MTAEARTPILVGLGEITARGESRDAIDVPRFMADAVRAAADDAAGGDAATARAILDAAGLLAIAPSATWPERDPGGPVAHALGIGCETARSSMVGGNGAQLIINELSRRVADGELELGLMAGAEALHSQQTPFESFGEAARPAGHGADEVFEDDKQGNSDAEISIGFLLPILGYALLEQAIGTDAGRSVSEQARVAAELWSRFSAVAAGHPNAWVREAHTPEQILEPGPGNRKVTHPYTKLMVANFRVDQAAGLVITSVAKARELGIDESKWVYVHAGAQANDEWFVSERQELHRSPAIAACGEALYAHAGIDGSRIGPVDLYSCFPSAVQIAARELGLPIDDPQRPLTQTGGLTFFGGPGNNFGTHGTIGVARALRDAPAGTFGISSSLGWYATKHAIGLYGSSAPERAYSTLRPPVAANHVDVVSAEEAAEAGPLTVEVATAMYGRDGNPASALVFARLADGRRAIGGGSDPALLEALVRDDFIGRRVVIDAARQTTLA